MCDNDFPLSVYVKKDGAWQLIDFLFTVGPLASRDFVIPIDISESAEEEIEIMLETGFMFWELDYAALDCTKNSDLNITLLEPSLAIGTGSQDWTVSLKKTDNQYMVQENVGEVTEIIFEATPPDQNQAQSVFLHSRGYYELVRDFKGPPVILELNKFKRPGCQNKSYVLVKLNGNSRNFKNTGPKDSVPAFQHSYRSIRIEEAENQGFESTI
jgi:hypothetical protein